MLKIREPDSEYIIKMCSAKCIYIDDSFYEQKMGEKIGASSNSGYKSYPVQVVAFRIGWFIRTEDGKNFLLELL